MGGDFGPPVTIPATLDIIREFEDVQFVLVGDKQAIHDQLNKHKCRNQKHISVHPTSQVVSMDEPPTQALRKKRNSSMRVALDLVKSGEVKACVSAGNTGALMATSLIVLGTFPGINRPAIITQIPKIDGYVYILDLGANVDCSATELFQFGIMGSTFVRYMEGIEQPRVSLLNVGTESIKGPAAIKEATDMLKACSTINYNGYVEGDGIFTTDAEVIVCDGFAGNVVIKTSEGVSHFIQRALKDGFTQNLRGKLAAMMSKSVLKAVKHRIDPRIFNGAALIGLQGTVIKSHGGADQLAFKYALRKAITEVTHDVPNKIKLQISSIAGASI